MIGTLGHGMCTLDRDLRYESINDWLAELNGLPAHEHIGKTISEVLPDVAKGVEGILREVLETGRSVINGIVEAPTPANPNQMRKFQHDYHVVRCSDGLIVGVKCIVQDITERKTA